MKKETEVKLRRLRELMGGLDSVVVAFSGGVDSTLVARIARDELGERCLAVTVTSELYTDHQMGEAKEAAKLIGIAHRMMAVDELGIPGFSHNPPDRCYFCKGELFGELKRLAAELGFAHVVDGCNADDVHDHRPGMRAAAELGVISPLKEAGLGKEDIREISKELGLPTWDRPSMACLASRFVYGEEITREKLGQVREGEELLRSLGFRQYRVRHHGSVARIEVEEGEIEKLASAEIRRRVVRKFRDIGFVYVTVDLRGFVTGSMNETLSAKGRSS